MKKIIAIGLTLLYLCFIVGTLIPSGLDIISYERSIEGRGNEKNESETSKGVEIFHILQVAKNSLRLKVRNIGQSLGIDKATGVSFSNVCRQLTSRNNFPIIDDPIFLKNRVFRL